MPGPGLQHLEYVAAGVGMTFSLVGKELRKLYMQNSIKIAFKIHYLDSLEKVPR